MKCPRCDHEGDDAAAGVCPRCDHDFTLSMSPREEALERFRSTLEDQIAEARARRERAEVQQMLACIILVAIVALMLSVPLFVQLAQES